MSDLDEAKRRILAKVDLPQLIGESVSLIRRAGHWVACCPFHAENTPSFTVWPDHYYCFGGCKTGGDAITFVRKREGLGYVDALRWLAGRVGVELPELDQAHQRLGRQRDEAQLYQMMLASQEFYAARLATPEGEAARDYLARRGFTPDSIRAFGFGMTPTGSRDLVQHLRRAGYRDPDMLQCSLATMSSQDGKPFDFLRQRVTLPIHDMQGRIIAFGGRTLGDAQPKYLNSRESRLFNKSRTLFGFDKARRLMREKGRAVLVEGYMDVLMLWQAGFPEAVACMGTAFTEAQMKLLLPATGRVILLFDGDNAGQKATLAAVNVALTVPEVEVRAVALPGSEDPDTFVRKNGPEALAQKLDESVPLLDFAIKQKVRATHALGIPDLLSRELVPWLAQVAEPLTRSFLTTRVAQHTGVAVADIERQLRDANAQVARARARHALAKPEDPGAGEPAPPLAPLDRVGHDFFGHVFHAAPGELDLEAVATTAREDLELGPEYQALLEEMLAVLGSGLSPAARPGGDWVASLDARLGELLARLARQAPAFSCNDRPLRMDVLRRELRRRRLKGQVARLKAEMTRVAADPGRDEELREVLRSISDLTRALQSLEAPPKAAPPL